MTLAHALNAFDELAALMDGRSPALFLDYDGTLTPIVSRPELAILDEGTRAVVGRLATVVPTAVVSGRDRLDVGRLVGLPGLTYAGSHGFDIELPDGRVVRPVDIGRLRQDLSSAKAELQTALAGLEGVIVEDKLFSLAIHYRLVDPIHVPMMDAAVGRAAISCPGLRRTGGKMVFELRPALPWDKGRAVLWLLAQLGLDGEKVLPIYIGDDETDRDAFAALRDRGVGIYVGPAGGAGDAEFWLDDTNAVHAFLGKLLRHLSGGGHEPKNGAT